MCTVSYLPVNGNGYILTSNRDESIQRPAALPFGAYKIGERNVYFPKDPQAGGTWIATTGEQSTICLLNGGFEPHTVPAGHQYRISRGQMVLSYFEYKGVKDFLANYTFENIAPFTLIIIERTNVLEMELVELRWNGHEIVSKYLDFKQPHIWSSVTLYPEAVRIQRQQWFGNWLLETDYNQQDVLDFHLFAGEGKSATNLVMNSGEKRTVSICSIDYSTGITKAVYKDLSGQQTYTYLVYH